MSERQYVLNTPITVSSDTVRIESVEADQDGLVFHYKIGSVHPTTGRFNVRERASVRVNKTSLPNQINQARQELIRAYSVLAAHAGFGSGSENDAAEVVEPSEGDS